MWHPLPRLSVQERRDPSLCLWLFLRFIYFFRFYHPDRGSRLTEAHVGLDKWMNKYVSLLLLLTLHLLVFITALSSLYDHMLENALNTVSSTHSTSRWTRKISITDSASDELRLWIIKPWSKQDDLKTWSLEGHSCCSPPRFPTEPDGV